MLNFFSCLRKSVIFQSIFLLRIETSACAQQDSGAPEKKHPVVVVPIQVSLGALKYVWPFSRLK